MVLGMASVRYSSSQCAAYARDKMDGFEYPPGYRIACRYAGANYKWVLYRFLLIGFTMKSLRDVFRQGALHMINTTFLPVP